MCNVLHKFNFPQQLINWIMCCIESVSFPININGHLSETWKLQRGIKQGDRVSPYIFILCMNFLILKSLLIKSITLVKKFSGMLLPTRIKKKAQLVGKLFVLPKVKVD